MGPKRKPTSKPKQQPASKPQVQPATKPQVPAVAKPQVQPVSKLAESALQSLFNTPETLSRYDSVVKIRQDKLSMYCTPKSTPKTASDCDTVSSPPRLGNRTSMQPPKLIKAT